MKKIDNLKQEIKDNCIIVTKPDVEQVSDFEKDLHLCNCQSNVKLLCGEEKDAFLASLSDIQRRYRFTQIDSMSEFADLAGDIEKAYTSARRTPVDLQRLGGTSTEDGIEIGFKGIKRKTWSIQMSAFINAFDKMFDLIESGKLTLEDKQMLENASSIEQLKFISQF